MYYKNESCIHLCHHLVNISLLISINYSQTCFQKWSSNANYKKIEGFRDQSTVFSLNFRAMTTLATDSKATRDVMLGSITSRCFGKFSGRILRTRVSGGNRELMSCMIPSVNDKYLHCCKRSPQSLHYELETDF